MFPLQGTSWDVALSEAMAGLGVRPTILDGQPAGLAMHNALSGRADTGPKGKAICASFMNAAGLA